MDADIESTKSVLSANVKALRRRVGLSQEALALTAEVDRTYVSQIERCIGNPSLAIVCRLAAVLGVAPWQLLRETSKTPSARKKAAR